MILRLCMTCKLVLGIKPGGDGISHGICDECRAEMEREARRMIVADPECGALALDRQHGAEKSEKEVDKYTVLP